MKITGYVASLLVVLIVPLVSGGLGYARFVIGHPAWIVIAMVMWCVVLTWSVRRIGALFMRRPGARLGAVIAPSEIEKGREKILGRAVWLFLVGLVVGQAIVLWRLHPSLAHSRAFLSVEMARPFVGAYVVLMLRWGLRLGVPLSMIGWVHLVEAQGWWKPSVKIGQLPPYPNIQDREEPTIVLGEIHERDGSRSGAPGYLILKNLALDAGILIVGGTGSGKSEGLIFPIIRQFVGLFADDPVRRYGALILDAKGDMLPRIRGICKEMGRERDLFEVNLETTRMNIIDRPDLTAPALAGYLTQIQESLHGKSFGSDNYWQSAAQQLAMQTIRLVRLGEAREPGMDDLYRVSLSPKVFNKALAEAKKKASQMTADAIEELESLAGWDEHWEEMAPQTRTSISSALSTMCAEFDVPLLRRCFCARKEEANFPGWDALIAEGKIVVVSMPQVLSKTIGRVVGTLCKMAFQDACLRRLAATPGAEYRRVAFIADEYDQFATREDSSFWARCRAARCVNVVAIQSYKSLINAGIERDRVGHFVGQLRTKVWLCQTEEDTAKSAAELCGKEERPIESRTYSESSKKAVFSFVDRQQMADGPNSASASTTWSLQERYRFPPRAFVELKNFEGITLPFDGDAPLPPTKVYLTRDFEDPNVSWFDWWERKRREGDR